MSDRLKNAINKMVGQNVIARGNEILQLPRIPTGSLSLDVETGGGIPIGRITSLVGPWSSGKTAVAIKIAAEFQRLWPDKDIYWIDAEGIWDPKWSRSLGLEPKHVFVVRPQYGEQAYDIALKALDENCGLVILDSIAALSSKEEIEKGMEDVSVAAMARLNSKFMRKMNKSFVDKDDIPPTFIFTNQYRQNVGAMYGPKEVEPGGEALSFYPSLKIVLRKGDLYDGKKTYKSITQNDEGVEPKAQVIKFYTEKNKTAPFKRRGHFWFYFDTLDQKRPKGCVDRVEETLRYLKKYGIVQEPSKGRFEFIQPFTGELLKFHGSGKLADFILNDPSVSDWVEKEVMLQVIEDMTDDRPSEEKRHTIREEVNNEEKGIVSSEEIESDTSS